MDIKKAIEIKKILAADLKLLDDRYCGDVKLKKIACDMRKALIFIISQQERLDTRKDEIAKLVIDVNRLDELEEKCPDCGGCGYDEMQPPVAPSSQPSANKCETCQGSGKVPVCYLPDNFVNQIGWQDIYREHTESDDFYLCRKTKISLEEIRLFKLSKQSNNRWKLEQITSLDKEKL